MGENQALADEERKRAIRLTWDEMSRLKKVEQKLERFLTYLAKIGADADQAKTTIGEHRKTIMAKAWEILDDIKGTTVCLKRGMKLLMLVRAHVMSKESKRDYRAWRREKSRYKMDLYLHELLERSIRYFEKTEDNRNMYQFFFMANQAVKKEINDAGEEIISLSAVA